MKKNKKKKKPNNGHNTDGKIPRAPRGRQCCSNSDHVNPEPCSVRWWSQKKKKKKKKPNNGHNTDGKIPRAPRGRQCCSNSDHKTRSFAPFGGGHRRTKTTCYTLVTLPQQSLAPVR